MNSVVTDNGTKSFIYDKDNQKLVINNTFDDEGYVSAKIVIKSTSKKHNSNYVNINLHEKYDPSDKFFGKGFNTTCSVEHMLQNLVYMDKTFQTVGILGVNGLYRNSFSLYMDMNKAIKPFNSDLINYLLGVLYGKDIVKEVINKSKSEYKSNDSKLKSLKLKLKSHKIGLQLVLQNIINIGNSSDELSKYTYETRIDLGLDTIGDSNFLRAKNRAYLFKGFTNKSISILENYFVKINDNTHEVTPISLKDILGLIDNLLKYNSNKLENLTMKQVHKSLVAY